MVELIITVLTVLALLCLIVFGLRSRYKAQIAGFLLELCREAEDYYGSGTGKVKAAYVAGLVYDKLPSMAKLVLSQRIIQKLIDLAAEELTEYLDSVSQEAAIRLISPGG